MRVYSLLIKSAKQERAAPRKDTISSNQTECRNKQVKEQISGKSDDLSKEEKVAIHHEPKVITIDDDPEPPAQKEPHQQEPDQVQQPIQEGPKEALPYEDEKSLTGTANNLQTVVENIQVEPNSEEIENVNETLPAGTRDEKKSDDIHSLDERGLSAPSSTSLSNPVTVPLKQPQLKSRPKKKITPKIMEDENLEGDELDQSCEISADDNLADVSSVESVGTNEALPYDSAEEMTSKTFTDNLLLDSAETFPPLIAKKVKLHSSARKSIFGRIFREFETFTRARQFPEFVRRLPVYQFESVNQLASETAIYVHIFLSRVLVFLKEHDENVLYIADGANWCCDESNLKTLSKSLRTDIALKPIEFDGYSAGDPSGNSAAVVLIFIFLREYQPPAAIPKMFNVTFPYLYNALRYKMDGLPPWTPRSSSLNCQFCNKKFKLVVVKSHERKCHENPLRMANSSKSCSPYIEKRQPTSPSEKEPL